MSRATADQRIDKKLVALALDMHPTDKLSVKPSYRFYDTNNIGGGYVAYNPLTGQWGRGISENQGVATFEAAVATANGTTATNRRVFRNTAPPLTGKRILCNITATDVVRVIETIARFHAQLVCRMHIQGVNQFLVDTLICGCTAQRISVHAVPVVDIHCSAVTWVGGGFRCGCRAFLEK